MQKPLESESSGHTSLGGVFLRLFWMAGGNLVLMVLAIFIGQKRPFPYHLPDLLFGATVILLIIARYADIAYYEGGTSYGEKATIQHWRRYVALLVAIALAVLAAAHGIAYFG
jgi:hypothetical protein